MSHIPTLTHCGVTVVAVPFKDGGWDMTAEVAGFYREGEAFFDIYESMKLFAEETAIKFLREGKVSLSKVAEGVVA